MLIYKGKRYTINTDGINATKSDGITTKTMAYYPERDASAIAGEIDELTTWRLLRDISEQATIINTPISPEHILIDGEKFHLSEWSTGYDPRFTSHEGYSAVWALGASIFYIFLGCHVFQGLGGKGQTASTPIPTLRGELPELSKLIAESLDYDPDKRPTLYKIRDIADLNISKCNSNNKFLPLKQIEAKTITQDELDIFWPDEIY